MREKGIEGARVSVVAEDELPNRKSPPPPIRALQQHPRRRLPVEAILAGVAAGAVAKKTMTAMVAVEPAHYWLRWWVWLLFDD